MVPLLLHTVFQRCLRIYIPLTMSFCPALKSLILLHMFVYVALKLAMKQIMISVMSKILFLKMFGLV